MGYCKAGASLSSLLFDGINYSTHKILIVYVVYFNKIKLFYLTKFTNL